MIKRAVISVSNKTGIVDFARELASLKVEILSTGGTARFLRESGIAVVEVSDYTGFPEMMDGRVKTLHPRIHGGILCRRNHPKDVEDCARLGISMIDMVVVNLYPFGKTVANPNVSFDDAIENIDIGGPAMLRAAAKNFRDVVVIVDPEDYAVVLSEMMTAGGTVSSTTKLCLAQKVFAHTAEYDTMIAQYLKKILNEGR